MHGEENTLEHLGVIENGVIDQNPPCPPLPSSPQSPLNPTNPLLSRSRQCDKLST